MALAATHEDIKAQVEELQARRRVVEEQVEKASYGDKVGLNSTGHFDMDVYTSGDKSGYVTSIPANEEEDEEEDMGIAPSGRASYTAPSDVMADLPPNEQASEPFEDTRRQKILERYDEYHRRQIPHMVMSPMRADPLATIRW
jgi:splicing factor 3B subunit 1